MLVSILLLNYKQSQYLPRCLQALSQQTYSELEIIFTDNASGDGSVEFVRTHYPGIRVLANEQNLYYCMAHNQAIHQAQGEFILLLNVDILLQPDFVEQMVAVMQLNPSVGMVSGKLLQMNADFEPVHPPIIDSTGLWFTPELRHFDRGAGELDNGQYERVEYIFGPSGAAPLYRRSMLDDLAFHNEYLDEDFVIYREDSDLAWRAQLLGWKSLYAPKAVAHHVRRVRPTDSRKNVTPELNMHSVKNRFLMRIKNQTFRNGLHCFFPTLWRDLLVVGYVILVERTSFPAFPAVLYLFPRALDKRRDVQRRRRISDRELVSWFKFHPSSKPFKEVI